MYINKETIFKEMTSLNKISGKIINYNDSYSGEIIFDENIISINKIEEKNSTNYIIPGFVDLHCHGGGGFDTMDGSSGNTKYVKISLSQKELHHFWQPLGQVLLSIPILR